MQVFQLFKPHVIYDRGIYRTERSEGEFMPRKHIDMSEGLNNIPSHK